MFQQSGDFETRQGVSTKPISESDQKSITLRHDYINGTTRFLKVINFDGIGISGQINEFFPYYPVLQSVRSLSASSSTLFVSHAGGVDLNDRDNFVGSTGIENSETEISSQPTKMEF